MSNIFIWSTDRTVSGATSPDQSAPRSAGNEGVLSITPSHQSANITKASPPYCLMSYPGHLFRDAAVCVRN